MISRRCRERFTSDVAALPYDDIVDEDGGGDDGGFPQIRVLRFSASTIPSASSICSTMPATSPSETVALAAQIDGGSNASLPLGIARTTWLSTNETWTYPPTRFRYSRRRRMRLVDRR